MTIELKIEPVSSFVDPSEQLIHYSYKGMETFESPFASIDFQKDTSGNWNISWVKSNAKGQGTRIVAEFRGYVGKDQKVHACINERVTQQKLLDLGFMECVRSSEDTVVITEPEIFAQLKAVRMLEKAGLFTERLELKEVGEEESFSKGIFFQVLYFGRT